MLKDLMKDENERTLYNLMRTQLSDYFYGISLEIAKIQDSIKTGKYTNYEIIEMLEDLCDLIY